MEPDESQSATTAHTGLFQALAAAQSEMSRAAKDSSNLHFKSSYADLASVMRACMGPLNRHGIAVIQPTGEDEHGRHVKTILVHESGQTAECSVPLIIAKNDMQGYGSAVTYARRYGLMSMAGVAADDDDSNAAAKAAPTEVVERRPDAAKAAATSLGRAETLDMLKEIWKGLPKGVQANPDVIAAKDKRKAELDLRDSIDNPAAEIDDEIPEFEVK